MLCAHILNFRPLKYGYTTNIPFKVLMDSLILLDEASPVNKPHAVLPLFASQSLNIDSLDHISTIFTVHITLKAVFFFPFG